MSIHPTALVSPKAELATNSQIGPYAIVEDGVSVAADCRVGAHAVLKRGLRLGSGVIVHEGAVLGGAPQDIKFRGGDTGCEIGRGTVVREFATVHRSTRAGDPTQIGKDCYLMGYAHIGHDCIVADNSTIASYTALAGHVRVGEGAFVSGGVVVHQYTRIGELSFIGGGSKVNMDVPPFVTVDGVPARAVGLNVVGLKRAGLTVETRRALRRAFRLLFRSPSPRSLAVASLAESDIDEVRALADFFSTSERGVCRARSAR